mmetsp:Transcript_7722/g.18545  ORF Transcript_7722/g.18545 Transcript_7722/m.18545 type:complete len:410 (+) Transcript_7722:33-1262(+)
MLPQLLGCYVLATLYSASANKLRSFSAREELGVLWQRCAVEGAECPCSSGLVRFGEGDRWVAANRAGALTCNASTFGEDPAFNRMKECWCAVGERPAQPARTAIVMLSRHPPDLKTWIRYHLHHAGVEHIFIKAEDSPQVAELVRQLPAADQEKVSVWESSAASLLGVDSRPPDDYTTLQARQTAVMARAKSACEEKGIDWLIHIDDDELLYTPQHRTIGDLLAAVPSAFLQAYLPNVEAVYNSPEVESCFEQTDKVNLNRYTFQSYANGKSAVRVAAKEVHPAGPHLWRDSLNQDLQSVHLDQEPFGAPIMVVHYESCPFSRWQDKFWELGNTSPESISRIPFPFYRKSISQMQTCRSVGKDQSLSSLGCDQASLMQLWSEWKTARNPALKEEDLMPIHIPWEDIRNA